MSGSALIYKIVGTHAFIYNPEKEKDHIIVYQVPKGRQPINRLDREVLYSPYVCSSVVVAQHQDDSEFISSVDWTVKVAHMQARLRRQPISRLVGLTVKVAHQQAQQRRLPIRRSVGSAVKVDHQYAQQRRYPISISVGLSVKVALMQARQKGQPIIRSVGSTVQVAHLKARQGMQAMSRSVGSTEMVVLLQALPRRQFISRFDSEGILSVGSTRQPISRLD